MSAPQELEIKQARRSPPNPSPPLEDDLSEAGNIFQRSDDEVEDQGNNAAAAEDGNNNSHIIPKSPDEFWKRSVSMRGGRGGPAPRFYNHPNKYSPPLSIGMPSWGSMEDHGLEDTQEGGMNVITPAVKGQMQHPSIHPNMFCYPPSSPIKTSPPSGGSPVEEFEGGDEFLPPQPSTRRAPNADTIKTPRDMNEPPIHFPSDREPSIKPQFVRETKVSKTTPPRRHPSLVVDASTSHDSAETPGRSLQGGRVQVVGGDAGGNAWSLVSHSRSIESGEDSWSAPDHGSVPSPTKRYGPPPMYHPYIGGPPISHSSSMPPGYPPRYGMPPGPPPGYDREGWSPYPPRYEYGRYPYPPPHGASYPPPRIAEKNEEDEDAHPLLEDYNPHHDSVVRPQFQNTKKRSQRTSGTSTSDMAAGGEASPRKRRRRNPEEKLASAAAMAAAATAAAARKKQKEEQMAAGNEVIESDEDEVKTVGSVEDEDMPAAKRAAMASAVALRAAAGGCECILYLLFLCSFCTE